MTVQYALMGYGMVWSKNSFEDDRSNVSDFCIWYVEFMW